MTENETYEPTDEAADEFGAESDDVDSTESDFEDGETYETYDDSSDEFGASDVDPDEIVMPDDWDPSLYTEEQLNAEPEEDRMD